MNYPSFLFAYTYTLIQLTPNYCKKIGKFFWKFLGIDENLRYKAFSIRTCYENTSLCKKGSDEEMPLTGKSLF